ncbi:rhodanese-like domain-containing protein [Candidatus Gracilibacteria bacterium]|nr:rhodanese-like domain-containing protein [Candidatus Gracilibacteria bacterium]MCF7898960.1 rhodanese-like domain-containing protein [Candidatus Paceibacterota bacterium]
MLNVLFGKKDEVNYKELVEQGAIIIDVRSKDEFDIVCVEGAINIPLDVLPLHHHKIGSKDTCVIAYCASGNRSGVAKNALNALGYTNVHNGGGWHSLKNKLA